MAGLYLDEVTDPELLALPRYKVGDLMRITRIKGNWASYPEDTQECFRASLGRKLKIKEVMLWACDAATGSTPGSDYSAVIRVHQGQGYLPTYTFYVAHLTGEPNRRSYQSSIYLDEDEIEPVRRRVKASAAAAPAV